jgi:hypothetical protein
MEFEAVRIEGHLKVLALHRMLMEYKFEDIASEFAGSPFIAAIQNRLADALEAADAGSAWRNWRKAETHTDRVESIRLYLAGAGGWVAEPRSRTARRTCEGSPRAAATF